MRISPPEELLAAAMKTFSRQPAGLKRTVYPEPLIDWPCRW
jgi:hypothetical protein